VLELGTFTGVSALALHEATKDNNAEIVTIDVSEKYLAIANDAFKRHGASDRIRLIKGNCLNVYVSLLLKSPP
jgi:predicted O-methyltransferase YrrM